MFIHYLFQIINTYVSEYYFLQIIICLLVNIFFTFCHKKFNISGSQSGRNHPLGAILRGKGAIKSKGEIGGKTTQGEKRSINNIRSLS